MLPSTWQKRPQLTCIVICIKKQAADAGLFQISPVRCHAAPHKAPSTASASSAQEQLLGWFRNYHFPNGKEQKPACSLQPHVLRQAHS